MSWKPSIPSNAFSILSGTLCCVFWTALCGLPAAAQIAFQDSTAAAGIDFDQHGGPVWGDRPPSHLGSGGAVSDFDHDGDLDLYICDALNWPNRLYRNNGDGTFTDIATAAGVADTGYSQTALFLDLDSDGWDDLVVVNNDERNPGNPSPPSRIYRNNGDGTFTDRTSGSNFLPAERIIGGAGAGDYDRDGDLDISVVGWHDGSTYLFRNDGDFSFTNVTTPAGAYAPRQPSNPTYQLGVVHVDIDNDGWQDIFSAVDFSANYLLRNNQDGTFTEITSQANIGHTGNDMGIAVADVDNDFDLDLYVTDITGTGSTNCFFPQVQGGCNSFNINDGSGVFTDIAQAMNMDDTDWGWGAWFADLDLDLDRDLFVVNGFDSVTSAGQVARLWRDDGAGYTEIAAAAGIQHNGDSRSVVPFDYDNDGDMDILVLDAEDPAHLFENITPRAGRHWLKVSAEGQLSNRSGVGARVFVTAGGVTQMHEIFVGGSFYAGPPLIAHFGLGTAALVDEVRVEFPSGHTVVRQDVAADQELRLGPLGEVTGVTSHRRHATRFGGAGLEPGTRRGDV